MITDSNDGLARFNTLFSDYKDRFVRFAVSYLRDMDAAEDVVMEAFAYYWEHRAEISDDTNLPGYVLTVVKHKCLNTLRAQQITEGYAQDQQEHVAWELNLRVSTLQDCEPYSLFTAEIHRIVEQTLQTFPAKSRQIFRLSRFEQKSHLEIANSLDITPKAVEYHITKVLTKLRENLKDYIMMMFSFL